MRLIGCIRSIAPEDLKKWQIENPERTIITILPEPNQYPWVFITYAYDAPKKEKKEEK